MFKKANFITFIALGCGWVSISLILKGDLHSSFVFALLAFIFDCFDGYVARRYKEDSSIGRRLDSLADVVIYLVYPALVFNLYFKLNDPFSLLIQSIFLFTGTYRLARFNSMGYLKLSSGKAYPGVPVVLSFINILIFVLVSKFMPQIFHYIANLLTIIHSVLMVSMIPFSKPRTSLVVTILVITLLIFVVYGKAFI